MATTRNRACSLIGLPSLYLRGQRCECTERIRADYPNLWGSALRQRCDRNVQRPRLNLLLEHDHSPELAWLEHYPQIYVVFGEHRSVR